MGAGSAGGAVIVVPTDPPDNGGGGTDPEPPGSLWAGWPSSSDTTLLSLRPHGRRYGIATVAPTGADFTTVGAGSSEARAEALNAASAGSLSWDGIGPDYRNDVLIGPGTYNEGLGGGDWACYVGTTGNPADVILQADGGGGGVIHSFGSQYLEALTLRAYSSDGDLSPKYPWHITGGPVTIAQRCIFDTRGAVDGVSTGGNRTAGLVGKDSSTLTAFYDCTFKATPGTADGFNMHGEATMRDLPETALFIKCTTEGVASIGSTGNLSLTGQKSRLYVIGLVHDEHLTEITADANTDVYTDSDLPVTGAAAVYRGVTTWPTIVDGLLPELADFYYPSSLGDEPVDWQPTVPDAAPMAPVVGRTYITRVDPDIAMRVTHSGFTATTAAGNYGIVHRVADTAYVTAEPVTAENLAGGGWGVALGKNAWAHPYAFTRYPGNNGFWVKVAWTDATVRVTGSAALPGIIDCYYTDDGTTLVPVAEGTPHPVPFVRAA